MTQQIYHLNEQGQLEPMNEEPFDSEKRLQEILADHPELLSGEQMNPGDPLRFILIGREQGIADIVGGASRWSLDHLLIDQNAVPTLVEAKRAANSEIRRSIVGQMLDYAAHATQTWNVADIRQAFEARTEANGQDPNDVFEQLLQSEDEPDPDDFWQRVETNLRAARLRLLFVADGIPDELTRVVEFLNEQMQGIEVLAVEIKQFQGKTGRTLVPRVIGRTAEAVAAPTRRAGSVGSTVNLTEQTFLESFPDELVQQAAIRLFGVARRRGARLNWLKDGATISLNCEPGRNRHIRIARLYVPGGGGWMGARGFVFGAGNGYKDFFESLSENLRRSLEDWATQFANDANATDITQTGLIGYDIPHEAAAANIDLLAQRLENMLVALQQLEPEEPSI